MLAKKPPMGFNTWNTFGADINDDLVRGTADAMVDKGLLASGYEYLVIDDCWSNKKRDSTTGKITPNHKKFPHGMKDLSDYVHSKGMKFGMYSCAGTKTCAEFPGSFDHEFLDAETFAEYGADFLKYDFCYKPEQADGCQLYRRISMALKASGRDILLSACNWGSDSVGDWIRSTGAHMYRSTGDINDSYESFRDIALSQLNLLNRSGPGCYNDLDMLTVGMNGVGNVSRTGCTETEYKTQFALWCMLASPLMLGCDIRNLNGYLLELVKNKGLIRIDQDEEARPAFLCDKVKADNRKADAITLFKVLSDNEFALMFANLGDVKSTASFDPYSVGVTRVSDIGFKFKSVFTDEETEVIKDGFSREIEPHDCDVFIGKLTK